MSHKDHIREQLLRKGASNLREFGYEAANTKNILTDFAFRPFFRSMLEEAKGQGSAVQQMVVKELLAELDATEAPT